MSKEKSVNQKCLENILCHLTKMVILTEHDEIDDLKQFVKMSISVSAQLLGVTQKENSEYINKMDNFNKNDAYKINMTSKHIDDYIRARQGKLSRDEISLLIQNNQIDHLQFNNSKAIWEMWDNTGKHFEFYEKD